MPDERYTRCPGCATVFRVTQEQLALRSGQVRCGQCKTVFDGVEQQVSLATAPPPEGGNAPTDDAASAPTTIPSRDAPAVESPPDMRSEGPTPVAGEEAAGVPYEDRFSPASRRPRRRARAALYAAAMAFLLLLIAAQAAFHFRDAVAARWPMTRAPFARLCEMAGCAIGPLRDAAMGFLSIEASDLQADPAHRGLLILTATLRNRAGWSLAYPHLELTLTDAQDRVVVRRALSPAEYAGGTADLQRGIEPNGEIAVKIFIDASATSQAGYRLYMFYP